MRRPTTLSTRPPSSPVSRPTASIDWPIAKAASSASSPCGSSSMATIVIRRRCGGAVPVGRLGAGSGVCRLGSCVSTWCSKQLELGRRLDAQLVGEQICAAADRREVPRMADRRRTGRASAAPTVPRATGARRRAVRARRPSQRGDPVPVRRPPAGRWRRAGARSGGRARTPARRARSRQMVHHATGRARQTGRSLESLHPRAGLLRRHA